MFDSLAERISRDDRAEHRRGEVALRWSAVVVISVLVFSGLYFVVHFLE
jgi:hypothetical protein